MYLVQARCTWTEKDGRRRTIHVERYIDIVRLLKGGVYLGSTVHADRKESRKEDA